MSEEKTNVMRILDQKKVPYTPHHYAHPDGAVDGASVAAMLGLRSPWQAREYLAAMRRYSGVKTLQIIGEIRNADARSKGVENSSLSDGDILRELVFKILH